MLDRTEPPLSDYHHMAGNPAAAPAHNQPLRHGVAARRGGADPNRDIRAR